MNRLLLLSLLSLAALSAQVVNFPVGGGGGSIPSGTIAGIPATCSVGGLYFATDETPGSNLYECTSTNTWTREAYRQGTALPGTCTVGQLFFKTSATAGQNLYGCTATNTWSLEAGGGGGASLPATTNVIKGDGSGGAAAATPGTDYYKPGTVIAAADLPTNAVFNDAANTFSDPGNQYFGKYDVACDATGVSADNLLVKKSGAACVALTTSDTGMSSGLVGLLVGGSTTANGRVRFRGVGTCTADGTINTGDWITPSTTNAGHCIGSGSRPAAGTVIIGRATANASTTVTVDVQIDPNSAGGSSVTLKTNGTSNGSQSTLNLAAGSNVTLTDNGTGTVTIDSSGSSSAAGIVSNHGEETFTVPANPTPVSMWTDTVPAIPANQCIMFSGFFENPTGSNSITITATYGSTAINFPAFGAAGLFAQGMICADATQANIRYIVNSGISAWGGTATPASGTAAESTSTSKNLVFTAVDSAGGDTLRVVGFQARLNDGVSLNGVTVSGTPSTGDVLTATSSSAAHWAAAAGGGGACTTTLAAGTNQIAGALAANATICITGNQTQNTSAIAVTQAHVTLRCTPGTSISQATASTNLFTVTGDYFQMEGCTLKPVTTGTSGVLVSVNANHSKLTNVVFDITGSTATNGNNGWWEVTGGDDHQVLDSQVIASTDNAFLASDVNAAITGVTWRNVVCEMNGTSNYCFNTFIGSNGGVNRIKLLNSHCNTKGGCSHFVTGTGDYQLVGNTGSLVSGGGSTTMFSNFAGVNAVYADNICNDNGISYASAFVGCFSDHDSTGTAFHHNIAVMTGGHGQPFQFLDARGLDIDGNIAKPAISTSTGQVSSSFGFEASGSCIQILNESTAADNSYNRVRGNTCYLPPSFTGIGINVACTLTSGNKCNDTKIESNVLIGNGGAGVGIEADQASTNTFAGLDIQNNRLITLGTGIKTTGTITNVKVGANTWTSVTTPWSFGASAPAILTDPLPITFANIPANVSNGSQIFLSDGNSTCTAGSSTGRTCFRENGAWTH